MLGGCSHGADTAAPAPPIRFVLALNEIPAPVVAGRLLASPAVAVHEAVAALPPVKPPRALIG
jgi:hypothetical protein